MLVIRVRAGNHRVPMALSERDNEILQFEREWWQHSGTKEAAIQRRFAMSASHYYRLLARIVDDPDALSQDPLRGPSCRAGAALMPARQVGRATMVS